MGRCFVTSQEEVPTSEGDIIFIKPLPFLVSVGEQNVEQVMVLHACLVNGIASLGNDTLYNASKLCDSLLSISQSLGHVYVEYPRRNEVVRPSCIHDALHQHSEVVVVVSHRIDLQAKRCPPNDIQR